MYIVIDTNSINSDLLLKKSGIIKLASKAKEQGYQLCFPEVVLEEMVKHYRENVEKNLKDLQKSAKIIQDATGISVILEEEILSVEKVIKSYKKSILERIGDLSGIILGPSSPEQMQRVLKKSVLRKKPFDRNGAGLPDAVIWGNIMDLASRYSGHPNLTDARIMLVSNNHVDFCKGADFELHDDLIEELEDIDVDAAVVKIVGNLDNASDLMQIHSENIVTNEVTALFVDPKNSSAKLRKGVEALILNTLPLSSLNNDDIGFGDAFEDPTIDSIYEDYIYNDIKAELLANHQISITMNVSITCLLDVFVSKSEALHMEDLSIYDHNWNRYYVAAQIEAKIWFQVSFITDSSFQEILGFEIAPDEYLNNNEGVQ